VNANVALSAYAVPEPSLAVFQPLNVKPEFVKLFEVRFVPAVALCCAMVPVPPFALKATASLMTGAVLA
jgi:hypothetical protein